MRYCGYRFRIYPTKKQEERINKSIGCSRFIYNRLLALQKENYKNGGSFLSAARMKEEIKKMKQDEKTAFLKEVDSTSLQAAADALDEAYQRFFKKLAKHPTFKKKRYGGSYTSRNTYHPKQDYNSIRIDGDTVIIPKLKALKTKMHRKVEGSIVDATISVDNFGKYYISLCCKVEDIADRDISSLPKVGIDLGLKDLCITSEGKKYENHKFLKKSKHRIARMQRSLSKKTEGSRRYEKARIRLAKEHQKIANRRKDMLHKVSREIVMSSSFVAVEDLKIKNLLKNHKLAQAISDASWYEFVSMLEYKCQWYHVPFQKIGTFYASSQICHTCGYVNPVTKDLNVREVCCPVCGEVYDRDINAAKNILSEGLRLYYE